MLYYFHLSNLDFGWILAFHIACQARITLINPIIL